MLTGSARLSQEIKDQSAEDARKEEMAKLQRDLERKRKLMEAQVATLQAEFAANEEEVKQLINQDNRHEKALVENREEMGRMRKESKEQQTKK